MSKLSAYSDSLKEIIDGVNSILNVECAIFDANAILITSTETYQKRKGSTVHAPSIEEVITNGNVLVNKPGYMKSCIGCRFKDNCPATIELLNCINLEDHPVGVISITSFTKSGHDRIMNNIISYKKILNSITLIISQMISYKNNILKTSLLEKTLQNALDFSVDGMLIVDSLGYVSFGNDIAMELFSICDLYTLTVQQIFSKYIIEKIMNGESFKNKSIRFNNEYVFINCQPITKEDEFLGSVIRISKKREFNKSKKNSNEKHKEMQNYGLNSIKGKSPELISIKTKVEKIADSKSTVLILGETGTGKNLLAKAIHYESKRANNPFITVNCACVPHSLFESELFGYEEGAFTGAKKSGKPGWFELAQNGTLFLDEISEMPMSIQVKLLEVLQDHSIERLGGISSIPLDVRIITATNSNIYKLVEENKFRKDLFYRINVIPITLPPLNKRKDDVKMLAYEFLKKINAVLNKNIEGFSGDVLEFFNNYSWPGNIRELENVVEYAANMTDGKITILDIPQEYLNIKPKDNDTIKSKVENMEYELIKNTLDRLGWDVKGKSAAAEELGMGLRTLYRKLKIFEKD